MTEIIRVFVNAVGTDVAVGSDVRDALRAADPALADRAAAGDALITDARGIEIPLDTRVAAGSILRVVVRARREERSTDAQD